MERKTLGLFLKKVSKQDGGCWEWTGAKYVTGYGMIKVDRKLRRAHRLAYEHWVGQIPEGLFVLHTCDNRACVYPGHLWVGDNSDNMKDCVAKGRHKYTIPTRKLVAEQVLEIRKDTRSGSVLAKEYGVDESTIHYIRRRDTWKELEM